MSDPLVYWFCFASLMIVPIIMLGASCILRSVADSEPNSAIGFRTKLALSSQQAWTWANRYSACLWKKMGVVMLISSAAVMLAFSWLSGSPLTVLTVVVSGIQTLCMVLSVAVVQKQLRRRFLPDGSRREDDAFSGRQKG